MVATDDRRCIVRIVCAADGGVTPHDGRWVVTWNPHVPFGFLAVDSTDDPAKAKRFPSQADALRQLRTVSRVQSLRPDGRPNRPLMAVTTLIEKG